MASISGCAKADEADLVGNLTLIIRIEDEEDTITKLIEWPRLKGARVERWDASGSESRITAKDFLEYYAKKYVTATDGAYLSSSSSRPYFFDLSSAGRVWNDNLLWVSDECLQRSDEEPLELNNITIAKVSRKESFIDIVARAGNELEVVLKELEISRSKRVASKDVKVLEESDKIAEGTDLRLCFEVEAGLLEEQCQAKAREKMVVVMDDEFKKVDGAGKEDLPARGGEKPVGREPDSGEGVFQLEREKEREAAALKLKEVKAESEAEAERLVTASVISRNNLAGKLYQLRYTKAEIMAFSEGNYEEMEIMDKKEVEEREDSLNVAEKTAADNQETINQEIESSRLRVVNLEGLLEVEKKSSVELQKELDVAREREEQTLLYNAEDLALNQLTSELAELKEKAASGLRHEAQLAEYRIRELNEDIYDMKCNIRALKEQLLKREIELDTARTNLPVSEVNFEKLSSSIVGKDRELRNSVQIRDSLIARLDRLKADLRRLKRKKTQSRDDLAKIQAKNQSLVDDLAQAHRNVRRVVQREKEMNERINQLCARISESERELRVREIKYQKDLKFELDKRDGDIASGEGSREMKEFLRRKEELVDNMCIDLTNSRQKSIDLTRQKSEHIDQLTTELAESKIHHLKDNKRVVVTHQAFKELVVHEQEKCDGEALHQWQLSALVAFFVEEIKFLQIERDLVQDCFSGRTCVCKLDISSIDPIGVTDRGIGTTTAEQIARGREIIAERAPEYMASRTGIGGSSSVDSPTLVVGGRSTTLPSRKSNKVKKK
ncbi:hypothetical protein GIB67_033040 [Kingdonia uniflora]|uniref:Uncharacterized protein n=1 Tax=Kingdonia uniflora TaxID=39325 RepID=A0A7J7MYK5_9MAGN|nr:hypothetical protein GIB67_033040 [Kingdonia uniflora]